MAAIIFLIYMNISVIILVMSIKIRSFDTGLTYFKMIMLSSLKILSASLILFVLISPFFIMSNSSMQSTIQIYNSLNLQIVMSIYCLTDSFNKKSESLNKEVIEK